MSCLSAFVLTRDIIVYTYKYFFREGMEFSLPLLLLLTTGGVSSKDCLAPARYSWVATKTPYRLLAPKGLPPPLNVSALAVWGLVRHGTRYPSKEAIIKMGDQLDGLRERIIEAEGGLCARGKERLKLWKREADPSDQKLLHVEGEKELFALGERWHARLPQLFDDYQGDLEQSEFRFRATVKQRAKESGKFFASGLLGRDVHWEEPILPHDPVIRSYKLCEKWKTTVKKNPASFEERRKFEVSEPVELVRREMSEYLGLQPILTLEELDLLYVTCNFDLAWRSGPGAGPWCDLFTKEQLEVMEYREDLDYYWVDGPGYPVTAAQSCPLMKDLLETFSAGQTRKGTFYFSHSGAILKFLAFLGLFQDTEPLLSDNFDKMRDQREWRTSKIGPFAGNIFFVLVDDFVGLSCNANDDVRVLMFVNEVETPIPGCEEPCSMAQMREMVGLHRWSSGSDVEEFPCNFAEICKIEEGAGGGGGTEVEDDKY